MTGALRSLGGLTRLAALFLLTGILAATALARGLPETEAPPPEDDGGSGARWTGCPLNSRCPDLTVKCDAYQVELAWCCPMTGSPNKVCKCEDPVSPPTGCIEP